MRKIPEIARYLGLQQKIDIRLYMRAHNTCSAEWVNYGEKHEIKCFLGNLHEDTRSLKTLIVHELIHAWQWENEHEDNHGESFQRMARDIERRFKIRNIYLPEIDGTE